MNTYSYSYDFAFSPSMPVVDIEITPIDSSSPSLMLAAMIDSGADGSIVPLSQLRTIGARKSGQVIMRGITGTRTIVDIYEIALRIGPHRFPYVRVAADTQNGIMVLGRDVLNHLVVTLDGPAMTTEIRT